MNDSLRDTNGQLVCIFVGADRIRWSWTDGGGNLRIVTNAFKVFSVRLCGDIDLDGDVDAADRALHPSLSRAHHPKTHALLLLRPLHGLFSVSFHLKKRAFFGIDSFHLFPA